MTNEKCSKIAVHFSFVISHFSLYQMYSSPFFICTSFTYLRTNAEESSFLQIKSTLSFSATMKPSKPLRTASLPLAV